MSTTAKTIAWIGMFALAFSAAQVSLAADGDWLVRTRLIYIAPNDDADDTLGAVSTEVESDLTVEVDATYFFNDRFAVEGILATAAQEVTADLGGRTSLGSVYHAPATVLGQLHFGGEGKFRPYIGLGLNYTIFYSESGTLADLDLDSGSFGLAGQVGIDCAIGDDKVFNFDVKYIEISADVDDPDGILVGGSLGTVSTRWSSASGSGSSSES
jgi:outer membrane protein